MNWRGKDLDTIGDLSDAVLAVVREGTREDAEEFMRLYRAETVHAATNVGYLAGYFDRETAERVWDWFQCAHPIFGTYAPTPDEAFDMGRRMAAEPDR